MNNFHIDSDLQELQNYSINVRRDLHQIPELSGQEIKTSQYCQQKLIDDGYQITTYEGFTGFIADLDIDPSFDRIAFRTDMDALEMMDLTEDEFRSKHQGAAHNCGHDTHMAIALTTARYLSLYPKKLKRNIRFIFQMAEEDMRIPGADKMVDLGCMQDVDEVYALHNNAAAEYGQIDVNNGIMSSFGRAWTLDILGKSTHGSTPHKGLDAIREGARLVEDMDYIIAKQTNPFSPAVFVCGMFNGGTIPNAVADKVQARGTIRSMDPETDLILQHSFDSLSEQSRLRGFDTHFSFCGYPAVINHPEAYENVVQSALKVIPESRLNVSCQPMTGSEDFSLMINATPNKKGAMFFLGTGNSKKGICNYLHSNPYYVEDSALIIGAQIFIHLAT